MRKHQRGVSQAHLDWHKAVLQTIYKWVELHHPRGPQHGYLGGPLKENEKAVIRRRLVKLEEAVSWFWQDYGPGTAPFMMPPFSVEDAAALIVWPHWRALGLAKKVFSPKAMEFFAMDGKLPFNMDWFYVPEKLW
jgi:hypothetical protein